MYRPLVVFNVQENNFFGIIANAFLSKKSNIDFVCLLPVHVWFEYLKPKFTLIGCHVFKLMLRLVI